LWQQDLLQQQAGLADVFRRARFLVLDEADRVLDPGFQTELRVIGAALPARRSTLLFSATMTPSLLALQQLSLQNAHTFQVPAARLWRFRRGEASRALLRAPVSMRARGRAQGEGRGEGGFSGRISKVPHSQGLNLSQRVGELEKGDTTAWVNAYKE
jgi:DEAD/DEAH box helicase